MDADDSWLLLAFHDCLALPASSSDAESAYISIPAGSRNLVAHVVDSG